MRKELVCYCKTDLSPQSPRLDTAPMWPTFWRHLTQNTIWAMATAGIILCLFLDVSRILFVPYGTRSCAGKGVSLRTGLRELKSFTESGCRPEGNSRRSLSSPTSNTRKDSTNNTGGCHHCFYVLVVAATGVTHIGHPDFCFSPELIQN